MSKEIRVMILEAKSDTGHVIEKFEHSLGFMQEIVGGYIEAIRVNESITIWVNEEGKLLDLPLNFTLSVNGSIRDYVAGDVIITGTDSEGETVGLTDEEVEEIKGRFLTRRNFKL